MINFINSYLILLQKLFTNFILIGMINFLFQKTTMEYKMHQQNVGLCFDQHNFEGLCKYN